MAEEQIDEVVDEQTERTETEVEEATLAEPEPEADLGEVCSTCNNQLQLQCHIKGMGQTFPVKADGHCSRWS